LKVTSRDKRARDLTKVILCQNCDNIGLDFATLTQGSKSRDFHDDAAPTMLSQSLARPTTHRTTINLLRTFASQLPRPPPKDLPPPETFSSTSRPRQYYSRPQPRDLPPYRVSRVSPPPRNSAYALYVQRAWPGLLAVCIGGVSAWAAFLAYAANQERLSSSAMRRVLSDLRDSEDVRVVLGNAVRPEPTWYLNGSPWVHGSVSGRFGPLVFGHSHSIAHVWFAFRRSRCYRGTSTSASASKVTRVRVPRFVPFSCSDDLISYFVPHGTGRRRHGLLYEHPKSARRYFQDMCVSDLPMRFSHPPHLECCLSLTRFIQCVSRSLQTMARLSSCHAIPCRR
jgi:cytochrome c oxidase assembly factor 1